MFCRSHTCLRLDLSCPYIIWRVTSLYNELHSPNTIQSSVVTNYSNYSNMRVVGPWKNGNRQTISFKFEPSCRISSIHVQTRITLAWNDIFQKFKSLASSAWCALALGTRSRTIAALGSKLWSCKEGTCQRIYDLSMFKCS